MPEAPNDSLLELNTDMDSQLTDLIPFYVWSPNFTTLELKLENTTPIKRIKKKIFKHTGYNRVLQNLVYKGQELDDYSNFLNSRVQDNDTIECYIRKL